MCKTREDSMTHDCTQKDVIAEMKTTQIGHDRLLIKMSGVLDHIKDRIDNGMSNTIHSRKTIAIIDSASPNGCHARRRRRPEGPCGLWRVGDGRCVTLGIYEAPKEKSPFVGFH